MVWPTMLRNLRASSCLRLTSPSNNWGRFRPVLLPCAQVAVPQYKIPTTSFHSTTRTLTTKHFNEAIVTHGDEEIEGEGVWMKEFRKRGIYHEERYGHYHQFKVDRVGISKDKRDVTIHWSDGHTSQFDSIWLRHQCHCRDCKHDVNGMMKIEWDSLPLDICVLSVQMEGDKVVVFQWGTPDGRLLHQGAIPTATLRCYCYSDKSIQERRARRAFKFHEEKTIPQLECEEFLGSEEGVHKCLTKVNQRGICLLKNAPPNEEVFNKVMGLIGPIQSTMYGETFDVVATPNPINAAYSTHKLRLHMDLTFYENAPGIQTFHCWRFDEDTVGGSNMFLDVYEEAEKFRQEHPDLFDRLARFPVVFNSIHYNRPRPVHMENQTPIFTLNHLGELVSVAWNPNLQGPTELPKKDMMAFYEAYTAFSKTISLSESLYKMRFEVGDFLIFNNRRVLHGREAYSGRDLTGRHLHSAYVELSDFHSRVQALHNKFGNGRLASRSGSHSWF